MNSFVESSSSNEKRVELKENLLLHGISVVYGDIRLRIEDGDYTIINCTYECMVKEIRKRRLLIEDLDDDHYEIEPMVLNPNEEKIIYLEYHEND